MLVGSLTAILSAVNNLRPGDLQCGEVVGGANGVFVPIIYLSAGFVPLELDIGSSLYLTGKLGHVIHSHLQRFEPSSQDRRN